jgi:hypothetical protein
VKLVNCREFFVSDSLAVFLPGFECCFHFNFKFNRKTQSNVKSIGDGSDLTD